MLVLWIRKVVVFFSFSLFIYCVKVFFFIVLKILWKWNFEKFVILESLLRERGLCKCFFI